MSSSSYYSRLLPEADYSLWNELIERSGCGTLFHQTYWLRSFDRPFSVVGCFDKEGVLVGGMPFSYQKIAGLKIARPPYLTPYLGPVVFKTDGKYHRRLTLEKDVALSVIRFVQSSCDFIRIPLSPAYSDCQPFKQRGFDLDVEYTYVVKLDDMNLVWNNMDQDKRRKIRHGKAEGLSRVLSDQMTDFVPLLLQSLLTHKKILTSHRVHEMESWYASLSAKNKTKILLVKDSAERICAGAILVWDRRRAYYLLSGMNRGIASDNVMAFLLAECIQFCTEEIRITEFDFDGSEVPSVEVFFRGFGGVLTPRYSVMWGRPVTWPLRGFWKLINSKPPGVHLKQRE